MSETSNWMYVDDLTVNQAAALWCGLDPNSISAFVEKQPSEVAAIHLMLAGAIHRGRLNSSEKNNRFGSIFGYGDGFVSRDNLVEFARERQMFPAFLFDTLAPFSDPATTFFGIHNSNEPRLPVQSDPPSKNQGGRPPTYDWDGFHCEIVRIANTPDGLPESQAELVRTLLQWFSDTYNFEPVESSVKVRISKIYSYLKAKGQ